MKTKTTWCEWIFLAETDDDIELLETIYKTIGNIANFIYETGDIVFYNNMYDYFKDNEHFDPIDNWKDFKAALILNR